MLNEWLADIHTDKHGHWDVNLDDADEFGLCDITGLRGQVATFTLFIRAD